MEQRPEVERRPEDQQRLADLTEGLALLSDRVRAGCAAAGRDPAGVTVVVVTKTFPVDDVRLLAGLGVRDVGESRDQEALGKVAACADLPLNWHFIGRLQSNKARSVARYAALVHSVDRPELAVALGRGAHLADRKLDCLVQVSLDGDPGRGGVPADRLPEVAAAVAAQPMLRLRGIMAVAPMGAAPDRAFSALPGLSERVRQLDPSADVVSAGMSGDLESALEYGATHLRVGSVVLGHRAPLGYRRERE